jgi:hypothetical protein
MPSLRSLRSRARFFRAPSSNPLACPPFFALAQVATLIQLTMAVYFAVTKDVESYDHSVLAYPPTILLFTASVLMRPRCNGEGYMRFLTLHFVLQFPFSEGIAAATRVYVGQPWTMVTAGIRITIVTVLFAAGKRFRSSVAHLPDAELSEFLTQTVMAKTAAAFGPMCLLMFSSLACIVGGNDECTAGILTSTYLGLMLLALLL